MSLNSLEGAETAVAGLIGSLLEMSGDRDGSVREAAATSLHTIGKYQHALLANTAHSYLAKQPSNDRTSFVLRVVERVCSEVLPQIEDGLAGLLVNLATQEMIKTKDDEDLQSAASSLLVTLSRRFPITVMESLLQKFLPGQNPHVCIVTTMGAVASTNEFGFIQFLQDVLSRTIPMLSSIKSDHLRRAFAESIKQFSDSLREYCSNIEAAPDPTIKAEMFGKQFTSAYDFLSSNWLRTAKDTKVKIACAECCGEICRLLDPPEKLHEEMRKLLPDIIALYKKSGDHYPVTKGLCGLLEAAVTDDTCPLEPYLDEIWAALFPQATIEGINIASKGTLWKSKTAAVCEEIDYNTCSPNQAKNQSEVLRCFHVTATRFADKLVYYLLQKMQSGQEKHKLGGLAILRHLINSSGPFMADKRSLVILGLKPVLSEGTPVKVKKVLCQMAVALADHNYLEADGGHLIVEFLVKNLINPEDMTNKKVAEDPASCNQLREQCSRALFTLSNNITSTEKVASLFSSQFLWPYLLEFVCTECAGIVLPDLCRCLAVIAARKREDGSLNLDEFKNQVKVPGGHQLLARLMVSLNDEKESSKGRRSITSILAFLMEMPTIFHESLQTVFAAHGSALEASLNDSKVDQKEWETLVLKFLSSCILAVSDGEWRMGLAGALGKQMDLYNNNVTQKEFLFRCLGGVLARITERTFVFDHLDLMFRSVNQSKAQERVGCAQGVGYCAHVHTDMVLTKLENVAKWEHQRNKGSGFINFIKNSIPVTTDSDKENACLKATIILSYGYLLHYCPVDTVTQRWESTVIHVIRAHLEKAKDSVIIECLLQTIHLIAQTLHQSHLKADYTFLQRDDMLKYLRNFVKQESNPEVMQSTIRLHACSAASTLVKLDPCLKEVEIFELVSVLTQKIFPVKVPEKDSSSKKHLIQETIDQLHDVLKQIIVREATSDTATVLIKIMQPWLSSASDTERERAVDSILFILQTYYSHNSDCSLGHATELGVMGSVFGRLCPRLCDSVQSIRKKSLQSIHWTLALAVLHKGLGRDYKDEVVDGVLSHMEALETKEKALGVVVQLSQVLEARLPPLQMQTYLTVILDMLVDKQVPVSVAAANLLNQTMNQRGPHLHSEAEKLTSALLEKLGEMKTKANQMETYTDSLQALHSLAQHHLFTVLNVLEVQPLPFSQSVVDCWHTLSRDGGLIPNILEWALEHLQVGRMSPVSVPEGSQHIHANIPVLRIISSTIEIIKGSDPVTDMVNQAFPKLLTSILLIGAHIVPSIYPNNPQNAPPSITTELRKVHKTPGAMIHSLLKALLLRVRTDNVIHHLNEMGCWSDFEDPLHFSKAIWELCDGIGTYHGAWVPQLVEMLEGEFDTGREEGKVVAASCFGPFLRHVPSYDNRSDLLHILVTSLIKGLNDSSLLVRKLSVRGLGNVAHCNEADLEMYRGPAVNGMMAGLEDPKDFKDEVALEAMQGLSKLASRIAAHHMDSILSSILLRIRPCFEKESGALRSVAFNLFGELGRFSENEVYSEQVHTNIIPILLHLNDEEEQVQKACELTLDVIARLFQDTPIQESIVNRAEKSLSYNQFLKEISRALCSCHGERANAYALNCSNYFKSFSPRIKANAAMLTGALLGGINPEKKGTVSKDFIFRDLAQLLKEDDVQVRIAAIQAISMLHSY